MLDSAHIIIKYIKKKKTFTDENNGEKNIVQSKLFCYRKFCSYHNEFISSFINIKYIDFVFAYAFFNKV